VEPFILKKASHEHGLILFSKKKSYILRHISGQGPVVLALARDSIMQVPEERHMGCTVCVCVCIDPLSIF
jgi:hypothetical protein